MYCWSALLLNFWSNEQQLITNNLFKWLSLYSLPYNIFVKKLCSFIFLLPHSFVDLLFSYFFFLSTSLHKKKSWFYRLPCSAISFSIISFFFPADQRMVALFSSRSFNSEVPSSISLFLLLLCSCSV